MDCQMYAAVDDDVYLKLASGGCSVGGLSHDYESEHDLANMVTDFLENGSGAAGDSRCSSDRESASSELAHLYHKVLFYKHKVEKHESNLSSIVHSFMFSVKKSDLQVVKSGPCNASCIRFSLVKLLRSSGYDAAVCASKWPKCKNVPGGDHEYIDVVVLRESGSIKRFVIDLDFRSHFEIARAVESYDGILNSLPVVYVGSMYKLMQYLKVMVDAAKCSLQQNSMPLPPWRSLKYLQAKWRSTYQRMLNPDNHGIHDTSSSDHQQCVGHLRKVKSSLQSEMEVEQLLKPINNDNNWRLKIGRWKPSSLMTL